MNSAESGNRRGMKSTSKRFCFTRVLMSEQQFTKEIVKEDCLGGIIYLQRHSDMRCGQFWALYETWYLTGHKGQSRKKEMRKKVLVGRSVRVGQILECVSVYQNCFSLRCTVYCFYSPCTPVSKIILVALPDNVGLLALISLDGAEGS